MAKTEAPENTISKSMALYQRGCKVMPGGVSRNTVLRSPHPLYAERGEGCFVTDIEGTRRIDFANNMASLIHGHSHPRIIESVAEQLKKGTAFTLASEAEVIFAEHMCQRNPGFEKIRFVNSGTEAIMSCLKAARAYTSRPKIAKVEGAYHGLYDYAEVSQTSAPENWGEANSPSSVPVAHGTPDSALNDVIVIPFNDIERTLAILDKHVDQLACLLIDLMPHRVGLVPVANDFLKTLRKWTQDRNVLLVFDEVITFRSSYGGAQEWYDVRPDLTAMGKMIGGGFPVGAIAGRQEVMEVMNPLKPKVLFPHSGTFSANPITMVAGRVAMEIFDREAVARVNKLGNRARQQIAEAIKVADIPACVTGEGSIFRLHMKETPPANYRQAFETCNEAKSIRTLLNYLFENGVMMINTCSGTISTPMGESEIDKLADVMLAGLRKTKETL